MAAISTVSNAGAAPSRLGARLGWEMRRFGRRLGPGALVGSCLLALAGAAAWQSHAMAQRQQLLALQVSAARSARPQPLADAPGDAARQLAAFYAYLPAHENIPELLKQLVAVAEKNGVTLAKADYKPQPEDNADFMRYQVTLPIKADYARVQGFIVGALHALPTLTLDSVTFKREQIETGEVEARVQFNLLVRKAAAKGARQ
jgi:Tfp pilus assembly protein PilO